jgi:cyanophycinase
MKANFKVLIVVLLISSGCLKDGGSLVTDEVTLSEQISIKGSVKVVNTLIGDPNDVNTSTTGGVCLIGGGKDVDSAFKWMISKSGGGDFVVIRFDNSTGYNSYIYKMGGVNSVETVTIANRADANNSLNVDKIKLAEALFIAGGDQANYVNFWKNTLVEDAINDLVSNGVPIGGTSAGCAILGSSYFSALNGTVTSDQAMANPYNSLITLGHDDFITIPYLQNTITDQHYTQRGREGRLVTFMARMRTDENKNPFGVAVDEQTAVCIDENGIAKVYGINNAFFLNGATSGPEVCTNGQPLTWNSNMQAVKVYRITGSKTGNGFFNLTDFNYSTALGGILMYYNVSNGIFSLN